jgi:ParB family transcriptional regulator, chromosome partitioning protein
VNLSLAALHPSPWNPRGAIDDAALADLVASITTQGVLTPLLVRPMEALGSHDYEIVAGHRRHRAAQLAGLAEVPVQVKALTDDEARTVAIVENLQREDVHPLDEAQGYAQLQRVQGLSAENIADQVGKSRSYIAQRLALTGLVDLAASAFHAGHLQLGHAQVLASLNALDQEKAVEFVLGAGYSPDMPAHLRPRRIRTVADLARFVQHQVLQDLSQAIWPLDEIGLAEAPACPACEKRGGLQEGLFDEDEVEPNQAGWCRDGACFSRKRDAWLDLVAQREARMTGLEVVRVAGLLVYGQKPPKGVLPPSAYERLGERAVACKDTKLGLVVHGYNGIGQTFRICVADECKKHGRVKATPKPKAGTETASVKKRKEEDDRRIAAADARKARLVALLPRISWPLPTEIVEGLLKAGSPVVNILDDYELDVPTAGALNDRLAQALAAHLVAHLGELDAYAMDAQIRFLPLLERELDDRPAKPSPVKAKKLGAAPKKSATKPVAKKPAKKPAAVKKGRGR